MSWNGPPGRRPVRRPIARLRRDLDAAEAVGHQALLLRLRRDGCCPTAPSVFSESSLVYGRLRSVDGKVWHHAVISRDRGTPGRTSWSTRWRSASHASPRAAQPTTTPARRQSCQRPDGASGRSPTRAPTGRPAAAGLRRDVARRRPHLDGAGVALSVKGENATGPRLDFAGAGDVARLVHADVRRRTPTRGTCGSARRPTAAGPGRRRSGQRRRPARPGYVTPTGSTRSTATTARSP